MDLELVAFQVDDVKIAAIALGSNSFHLVILEVRWPS